MIIDLKLNRRNSHTTLTTKPKLKFSFFRDVNNLFPKRALLEFHGTDNKCFLCASTCSEHTRIKSHKFTNKRRLVSADEFESADAFTVPLKPSQVDANESCRFADDD